MFAVNNGYEVNFPFVFHHLNSTNQAKQVTTPKQVRLYCYTKKEHTLPVLEGKFPTPF